MNFAVVTLDTLPYGFASANYLIAQCKSFHDKGINVRIFVLSPRPAELNIPRQGNIYGCEFFYLEKRVRNYQTKFGRRLTILRNLLSLFYLFLRWPPDIINVSTLPWGAVLWVVLLKFYFNSKLIITRLEIRCFSYPWRWLYRHLVDGFIVGTTVQKNFYAPFLQKSENAFLLPNCIIMDKFIGSKPRLIPEKYFLYCGLQGHNRDGIFNIIEGYRLFCQNNKIQEIKLCLVGNIELFPKVTELKALLAEEEFADKVILYGRAFPEELPQLYGNAEALVIAMPEILTGGFPYKLSEYLASGVPVITTLVKPIDEFLTGEGDCYPIKIRSPQDIAKAMSSIVAEPKISHKIGENGQKVAQKYFNADCYVESFLQLFKN